MSQSARIFNIVRGSMVDGWGIRTTVFLKGCPLRCKWCCNPEGQRFEPELRINAEKCNGCGACVKTCSLSALTMTGGVVSCNRSVCTGCYACVDSCHKKALEPFGVDMTTDEVLEILKSDKDYFDISNGGLTLGGGEAARWPDFCLEIIDKCHRAGINVAVDTCGYNNGKYLEVLENADLLLYDIKGISEQQHFEDTGVGTQTIWNNLEHLTSIGKEIIIRIPVIPGHNDGLYDMATIAERLAKLPGVKRIDFICYHKFGTVKYVQLGKEYPLGDTVPPVTEEYKKKLAELFSRYGLNYQFGG